MGNTALVDGSVTLEAQYTRRKRVLQGVTLEVAVEDLDTAVGT